MISFVLFQRLNDGGCVMGSFENRTIAIVGGTTGLGLSAAQALVKEGARVLVMGRNPANANEAAALLGARARVIAGDACDTAAMERLLDLADGALDGLYHVAGGSGRKQGDGPLHEITDAGWDFTLKLNLTSVMVSNRAAVRRFLQQGKGGAILNMGSVLGYSPSPVFFASHAYAATKAAIIGFSQATASYYAKDNIRVNVLAPALVATPMAQRAAGDDAIQAFIRTKQPLDNGRIGRPDDLDAAALYFLGKGSGFTTGQVLAVDGGWCVSEGQFS